jgi:hypothetical protein
MSLSILALGVCVLPKIASATTLPMPGAPAPQALDPNVSIDENGIVIVDGKQVTDILDIHGVPTFDLGSTVVAGDVIFTDGTALGSLFSDILRFPNRGDGFATTIQLLSDTSDGVDNPGDTGLNVDFQQNHIILPEDPSEISVYQAGLNGEVNTYTVYSDAGIVPEPGSLALLATGGLPLLGFLRRRKRA